MKNPMINKKTAQILKIMNDDTDRLFSTKEIESRFQTLQQDPI